MFNYEDMPLSQDFSVNSIELIVPELSAIKGIWVIADAIKPFLLIPVLSNSLPFRDF